MRNINYLTVFAAIALLVAACGTPEPVEYMPIEEFKPAFEALVNVKGYEYKVSDNGRIEKIQCDNAQRDYDIEETVRILNGLEMAQMQAADFYSYLEYMAKQDYSMVPQEVLSAKVELLPILQEMYLLESQNEELSGLSSVMNSLGTGLHTLAKEKNPSETVSNLFMMVSNFIPVVGTVTSILNSDEYAALIKLESLDKAKAAAFDVYEKHQNLKSQNKERISVLKQKYLAYLETFTPVYMKYMKEWERLCIDKDKAYLAIYAGRSAEGYSIAQEILDKYPANGDALLLKALACVNMAKGVVSVPEGDAPVMTIAESQNDQKYRFVIEAQNTLDSYIDLYPSKAAPALLLLGEIAALNGNYDRAVSLFDQAAIEYPKLAATQKDVLNIHMLRGYLDSSAEGKYLKRLYNSTVEGYGWFSPNFHKAMYWEQMGDSQQASLEIYNHFFRRGNQGLYDCLLTDMEFCENNLFKSFKSQFMESSVLNLSVTEEQRMLGKNGIRVTLNNNSDMDLENVRLYLCLHIKDMYINEYDVLPCETINILAPRNEHFWLVDNYSIDDIVRVRAILMTDDRVCWVDDVTFKQANAKKNYFRSSGKVDKSLDMFRDYGLSDNKIVEKLLSSVDGRLVPKESGFFKKMVGAKGSDVLVIDLPRYLCLLDPVFSLGELSKNCTPSQQVLEGSVMRLVFPAPESANEPLYLYSDFVNLKINYELGEDAVMKVTTIEKI